MKLTEKKYKCSKCRKLKHLVIIKMNASLCEDCYKYKQLEKKTCRELNKLLRK